MAEIEWTEAPHSVIGTAEVLIEKYHPWLKEARIAFVMRSESQKKGKRHILASTCKIPAKMQPYMEFDLLIWLSEPEYTEMSGVTREALIDHELTHCIRNFETGAWSIRDHDIQEFAEIIERHGLWSPELNRIDEAKEVYLQGKLFDVITTISSNGKVVSLTGEQLKKASMAVSQ